LRIKNNMYAELQSKIKQKDIVAAIIGLGYVGLPLSLVFAEAGIRVVGIDINEQRVDMLNNGKSYVQHITNERIAKVSQSHLVATTDFSQVQEADVIIICVPTPLDKYREPDLSYVYNTIDRCKPYLREGQLVSLESTTYPGTTDEEIAPRLTESGLTIGDDLFLIYSPEREDPGNPEYNTSTIPKVCGGYTTECLELGKALYAHVVEEVVPVSSTRVAEMTKLLENIHRAVNIGMMNEMKMLADRMQIDIHEVIDAAATKPFGFTPYRPGPGIGGHCIPIDPFYLTWKAREFGMHTRFIELAGEINNRMPRWVVGKITDALNNRGKALMNSRILVLGVAYKRNVDDLRESPSLELMKLLHEKGADISYCDPHVAAIEPNRSHSFSLSSIKLNEDVLKQYDCTVLATAHKAFDYELIAKHAPLLIDTRGMFRENQENLVKA